MNPRDDLSDSLVWAAVRSMVAELTSTGEITVNTDPAYVIGFLCRELRAKSLLADVALRPRDARPPG